MCLIGFDLWKYNTYKQRERKGEEGGEGRGEEGERGGGGRVALTYLAKICTTDAIFVQTISKLAFREKRIS